MVPRVMSTASEFVHRNLFLYNLSPLQQYTIAYDRCKKPYGYICRASAEVFLNLVFLTTAKKFSGCSRF